MDHSRFSSSRLSARLAIAAIAAIAAIPLIAGLTALEPAARADDSTVAVVDGKFGDHIEQGHAVGEAKDIVAAHKAVYWVDVANSGDATQVTLVWSFDGKEVQRQSLDIGHSPHWRTWGAHPVAGVHKIDVQVRDASGKVLKEDSVGLDG